MERQRFIWSENFTGNWELLKSALKNPETIFVYDIDGILANISKDVLEDFSKRYGIKVRPAEINSWGFLTETLERHGGFDNKAIKHAEDGWFNPKILIDAKRSLFIKPVVRKTLEYYGPERNFVLTSRMPHLEQTTYDWFARELPEFPKQNILINVNGSREVKTSAEFKVGELQKLSVKAPWLIFIDDHVGFAKAVVEDGIKNCLVINIPQGVTPVDVVNDRLFVLGRYPFEEQGMFTLYNTLLVAHS